MQLKIKIYYLIITIISKILNLSISHEDGMGNFIIENYQKENIKWLKGANIENENDRCKSNRF